jgi:hypothetical protein
MNTDIKNNKRKNRFNEFLGKIPMPKHWHKNYFSEDSKKTTEKQVEKRWIKK